MPPAKTKTPAKSPAPVDSRSVLIAVTGSSPAILTEALWALAQENPPVIPRQVVVVTTTDGSRALHDKLLQPLAEWHGKTVWQSLRQTILGKHHDKDSRLTLEAPVLIAAADPRTGTCRNLDDIRSPSDNAAAAETILTTVRRFSTDPEIRIIGLLSGGRKTMGALLHAALSLAGRPGDRLLHVLVSEPFDHPRLIPGFYFPGQPGPEAHHTPGPDSEALANGSARIDLADVPLVALGELIFNRTGQAPATFAGFTRAAQATVADASQQSIPLKVSFSPTSHALTVNHYHCTIPAGRPAALCEHLCRDALADHDLADRRSLETRWRKTVRYPKPDSGESAFTDDDISNALNVLRDTLHRHASAPEALIQRLFPLRAPIGLNREGVTVQLRD